MDSLRLSLWGLSAVRFGLHGVGTLRDQTLPPGGMEAWQQDETEETGDTQQRLVGSRTYFL